MEEQNSSFSTSWAQIIKPGEKVLVTVDSESNLVVSNVCLGEVKDGTKQKANRLLAHVTSIELCEEEEENREIIKNTVLVASLIPFVNEHQVINYVFSPLNIVEFENQGEVEFHLAGFYIPLAMEEEEIEEEENNDSPSEVDEEEEAPPKTSNKKKQKETKKSK